MQNCLQIVCHPAEQKDLVRILEIWEQGWYKVHPRKKITSEQRSKFLENFYERSFPYDFWVVRTDEGVSGWVSILPAFYHPMKEKSEAEISIYIDRLKSNMGLGTMITRHVLEELENSGINTVWAFVSIHNKQSKKMCQNAGLSICGMTSYKFLMIKEYNT